MDHRAPHFHAQRRIARRAVGAARVQASPHQLMRALAACSLVTFWPGSADLRAQVLPTGMNIVNGQVSARTVGNTLRLSNSPNAIINWNSFSIGAGNAVRFDQAGPTSQVLNRVTGNDPSAILGSLSSNGQVWLLNPNGVLFGQGARVDVAGFVVSTLNLNNADWLAGSRSFTQGAQPPAGIVNQGELRSSLGGRVALIGGTVRNEGDINAPGGQVVLAAGSSVELVDTATPNVSVKLNAGAGEVVNLGRLIAAGGRIDVHAATVNQSGIVRADSLSTGPGGEVVLEARDQLSLGAGSQTSANGDSGGTVTLQADQTLVRGAVSATGSQGAGGQVHVLGRQVGLLDAAQVDVSGDGGGGEVLVGGGLQGKDPSVPNAQAVYFGPLAAIAADATHAGDGGRVILWSDTATRAYGSLSARGGALGGNGGFVETSGGWLDARPSKLDLSAPRGASGRWLLDPFDVTINDAGPDTGYDPVSFTANANGSTISTPVIKAQLDAGNSVTISTGGAAGLQAGNITMANATLSVTGPSPGSLTLIADGGILMSGATIQSNTAPMNVSLLSGRGGNGSITLQSSTIASLGGDITLGGFGTGTGISGPFSNAAVSSTGIGIQISASTLNAGNGTVSISGASTALAGVSLDTDATVHARITTINGSSTVTDGVDFPLANLTTANGGPITIQGVGAQSGVVVSSGSSIDSTPPISGASTVGVSGLSTGNNPGVVINGSVSASNGNSVTISGGNVPGPNPALVVANATVTVGSVPGTLTLGIINPAVDNSIAVTGSTLTGSLPGIVIFGASSLRLQDTTASAHVILLQADTIDFEGATSLVSNQPSGDVFVLSNRNNNGGLTSFTNNSTVGASGSLALQTSGPPARWIIWVSDITSAAFSPGALPYDFTLYGAANPSAWANFSGNGYASAAAGVATAVATINPRVYDTTQNVVVQGTVQATGPRGEVGVFDVQPTLQFADKNVGVAKPVQFVGVPAATFTDSLGKPAFGLTLQSGMTGDITPAAIALQGLSGNGKTYDSTTAATYFGVPSVTPLGSDNVTVSLPAGALAFFADKNVGNGKPITIPSMSLTGADAANYVLVTPSLSANILPFQLSLAAAVNDKVYDATVTATFNGTPGANFFAGDNVALTGGTAVFFSKGVGVNKPVRVSGFGLSGTDAGNYLAPPATLLAATITPATLTLNGLSSSSKVYDATTAAALSGNPSVTPLAGDSVGLAGAPVGNFADKNVGVAKPVAVSGLSLTGIDSSNYVLAAPASLVADITPATLVVSGLTANSKVYDATVAATLSGTASVTPLGTDSVSVSANPAGTFSDKNVGVAKSVSISAASLIGPDAGNYVPAAAGLRADITPATLSYVATPVTQLAGLALPPLSGAVSGFVGGDTLQNATVGTLAFTTPATSSSAPGQYAIDGSGLAATNYAFVQAAGNATALTLNAVPPNAVVTQNISEGAPKQALQLMMRPPPPPDPAMGGVVDLVAVASATSGPAASSSTSFEALDLSEMSQQALVDMLGARQQYKRLVFAEALAQLEDDPALADMPPCRSLEELRERACVVTQALKRELQSRPRPAAPVAPPAPAPGSAAAAPPAPAAVPSAPPAPVVAAAPPVAPATAAAPLFHNPRRVLDASLPQIQRKVALVIGVDRYNDPTIPQLDSSVGDAVAIGKVLESEMGYETVVLENPSKKAVVAALNELAVDLDAKDSVIVYYAGHGELVESTHLGYWILADSDAKRPETWLSNADIGRLVAHIEASQVALISDSCYSGSLVSDQRIRASAGTVDPAQVLSHRTAVVMSSGGNEPVADSGKQGHSPFAWALMNNLRQLSAWQPGGNVFERVRFAVAKELPQRPQYAAFGAGGHQAGGDYLFEQRTLAPEPR
jgi:filamentous hemagglutinin family protein